MTMDWSQTELEIEEALLPVSLELHLRIADVLRLIGCTAEEFRILNMSLRAAMHSFDALVAAIEVIENEGGNDVAKENDGTS